MKDFSGCDPPLGLTKQKKQQKEDKNFEALFQDKDNFRFAARSADPYDSKIEQFNAAKGELRVELHPEPLCHSPIDKPASRNPRACVQKSSSTVVTVCR